MAELIVISKPKGLRLSVLLGNFCVKVNFVFGIGMLRKVVVVERQQIMLSTAFVLEEQPTFLSLSLSGFYLFPHSLILLLFLNIYNHISLMQMYYNWDEEEEAK